ncbi:alpha/beta fold hydrolase [Glycomyces terrestris]|uniref:Alpha/beta hydrolase n=1 Tax=Glycomyces terrestris TaxID=2493553 RepID=A0A426UV93_9ACTN|nr:alpha/beta hydrolase [Glycomyces terrestris]RRR98098.1 alpha/beta hydrolase [Glycomyces terrestris]
MENISLTTKVVGSGPGIVLAHGAGGGIEANFGSLIPLLAEGHTVTGSDYPADDTPLELDALADALVAAAATERFTLIGYSLGTAVAVRAAARHPERVAGLVLAAGLVRPDNRLRLALDLWAALLAAGDRDAFARFTLGTAFSPAYTNALPAPAFAATVAEIAASVPGGAAAQAALVGRVDTGADLAGLAVPTLVVEASEDLLVDPANHRALAEAIPGAEHVRIEAGHVFMAERPEDWHRAVLDFLDRHGL